MRDSDHVEKAFALGGMTARNAVTAATMVQSGMTAVDDVFAGTPNFFSAFAPGGSTEALLGDWDAAPEILRANIKKWSVGSPIQASLDAMESLLEPFGNRVLRAESLGEAETQANRQTFDAIITGCEDADMLAAAPGANTPLIALLLRGGRAPNATANILRWPVEADLLYGTLDQICQAREQHDVSLAAAIDAAAVSTLERSVGVKTLVEILQCYIATAEQLTAALAQACAEEKWDEAARLAQDIIGAAGGLGLAAMTQAARDFTRKAREGENRHELCNAAQAIVGEHLRARQALMHLYPEVA